MRTLTPAILIAALATSTCDARQQAATTKSEAPCAKHSSVQPGITAHPESFTVRRTGAGLPPAQRKRKPSGITSGGQIVLPDGRVVGSYTAHVGPGDPDRTVLKGDPRPREKNLSGRLNPAPRLGGQPEYSVPIGWCTPFWSYFAENGQHLTIYNSQTAGNLGGPYTDPALSSSYVPPNPAVQATEEPKSETSALESAGEFMRAARYVMAADAFKEHLRAQPQDYDATRSYGCALLLAGKTRDGIEAVGRAFANDPSLADRPLNTDALSVTQSQLRELSGPVIATARRLKSTSGYITAAMLMQLRNRPDVATRMLDEAKSAGLDPELHARLSSAMAPPPRQPSAANAPRKSSVHTSKSRK